jgi:hypothetical protein
MDVITDKKKKAEAAIKKRRERDLGDIRKILGIPEGRRFVWRVLDEAKIFAGSFTGTSQTFFNEGRRDIGLFILKDVMEAKPDAFLRMFQEHNSEAKSQTEEDKNVR